ncbi:MAG TPA: MarR family transcriptional regulator [Candidatus Limnocylindria bacterium]|nr:MarR family transcriptional regulator [Candidatus Limnocylindria bacterium]
MTTSRARRSTPGPITAELPYALLARVRRALRILDAAIERGSDLAGLTVQQQAFLLALAARGGRRVPLALVRAELDMDQATASELLARLVSLELVERIGAADRRALEISLTRKGRQRFLRSVEKIRHEIQAADKAGDLRALRVSLAAYLDHYTIVKPRR